MVRILGEGILVYVMATKIRLFLSQFSEKSIPRSQFTLNFSRSSGPGGQNVNKVNSKATVRLDREKWAKWLPLEVQNQISQSGEFPYFTKRGDILVTSELSRSQKKNLDDCFQKLAEAIRHAAFIGKETSEDTLEKWKQIHRTANRKRLDAKRFQKQKKQSRKVDS